jgi:hypothetical protein
LLGVTKTDSLDVVIQARVVTGGDAPETVSLRDHHRLSVSKELARRPLISSHVGAIVGHGDDRREECDVLDGDRLHVSALVKRLVNYQVASLDLVAAVKVAAVLLGQTPRRVKPISAGMKQTDGIAVWVVQSRLAPKPWLVSWL